MFPGGSLLCETICKIIRPPILFLSSLDREEDRGRGLTSGGDAYMVKPCSLAGLGARVYACIRRNRMQAQIDALPCTNVMCNQRAGIITINGTNLMLTAREYPVMKLLVKSPGRLYQSREIIERFWGGTPGEGAAVRAYIRRFRKKLGAGWDD